MSGTLLVVTGPPGAGKSTLARALADARPRSVLVEGDAFFGFLASGGFATVYDGVVGPWFLPVFAEATGLDHIDYLLLLPDVARCVRGVEERVGHGFTDAPATRKMHREFDAAEIDARHVLRDPPGTVEETVHLVEDAAHRGLLRYPSGQ